MFRYIVRLLFVVVTTWGLASTANSIQAAELTSADAKKFFNDKHCNACHEVDEIRIGPSYQSISVLYANASPDIVDKMSMKIIFGGAGTWGFVPMISNPKVSQEESRRVARWILELHKTKLESK